MIFPASRLGQADHPGLITMALPPEVGISPDIEPPEWGVTGPTLSVAASAVRAIWISQMANPPKFDAWFTPLDVHFAAAVADAFDAAVATGQPQVVVGTITVNYRKTSRDAQGRRLTAGRTATMSEALIAWPDGRVVTLTEYNAEILAQAAPVAGVPPENGIPPDAALGVEFGPPPLVVSFAPPPEALAPGELPPGAAPPEAPPEIPIAPIAAAGAGLAALLLLL